MPTAALELRNRVCPPPPARAELFCSPRAALAALIAAFAAAIAGRLGCFSHFTSQSGQYAARKRATNEMRLGQ